MIKASEARKMVEDAKRKTLLNIDLMNKIVADIDKRIIAESQLGRDDLIVQWSDVFRKVADYILGKATDYFGSNGAPGEYQAYLASVYDIRMDKTHEVMQRLEFLYSEAGYEVEERGDPLFDRRKMDLYIKW